MKYFRELSRAMILVSVLLLLIFSAASANFYAGVVSETDISQAIISDRWAGMSGTVERGETALTSYTLGSLNFNESQTGEVLTATVEGIKGGGYYLAFTPHNNTFEPTNLENTTKSDLKSGELFSKEIYPSFYPGYAKKVDNPYQTFESNKTLLLDGRLYNASYANITGSADMYLLKYERDDGLEVPVFVSPIDGLTRGQNFENCYVSNCNFQALLPRLEGSSFEYSVSLLSRGESVNGCETVETNTTSLVLDKLGSEDNCVQVEQDNAYVDFYNSEHIGEGQGCAVELAADNVTLNNLHVESFEEAICVEGAENGVVSQSVIRDNSIAITAQNSNISVSNITSRQNNLGLVLQGSHAEINNFSVGGSSVYGDAQSVRLESVAETLPRPSGISDSVEPVGSRVQVEALSDEAKFERLGLGYPGVNTSKILPDKIYKYDYINGTYTITDLQTDLVSVEWNNEVRYAQNPETLTNFSVFSLYGQNIEEESNEEAPTNQNSQSGSGGFNAGGGPGFQSQPEPPALNLSLEKRLYNVNRGDAISIEFEADNIGSVAIENVTSELDANWTSVPRTFPVIRPNESRSGAVLVTVPENAKLGNRSMNISARYYNTVLDSQKVTLNVSTLEDEERLNIIESPSFLTLETATQRYVGVRVENPTPKSIREISASFREGGECATIADQQYEVEAKSTKNIRLNLQTSESRNICNDVIVFRKDGELLGYTPVRVEIRESDSQILSIPVYLLILLIWTSITVWRIKSRKTKERRFY